MELQQDVNVREENDPRARVLDTINKLEGPEAHLIQQRARELVESIDKNKNLNQEAKNDTYIKLNNLLLTLDKLGVNDLSAEILLGLKDHLEDANPISKDPVAFIDEIERFIDAYSKEIEKIAELSKRLNTQSRDEVERFLRNSI